MYTWLDIKYLIPDIKWAQTTRPVLCTEAGEGPIVILTGGAVQAGVRAAVGFVSLTAVLHSEDLQTNKIILRKIIKQI